MKAKSISASTVETIKISEYPRLKEALESLRKHKLSLKEDELVELESSCFTYTQQGPFSMGEILVPDTLNLRFIGICKKNPRDRWNKNIAYHLTFYRALISYIESRHKKENDNVATFKKVA